MFIQHSPPAPIYTLTHSGRVHSQASRSAVQGLIGFARDDDSAVLVELNSETDFVSRNEQFTSLLSQIAQAALRQTPKDSSALRTLHPPYPRAGLESRRIKFQDLIILNLSVSDSSRRQKSASNAWELSKGLSWLDMFTAAYVFIHLLVRVDEEFVICNPCHYLGCDIIRCVAAFSMRYINFSDQAVNNNNKGHTCGPTHHVLICYCLH